MEENQKHSPEWNARRYEEIKEDVRRIKERAEKRQGKAKPIEWLLANQTISKKGYKDANYARKRKEAKKKK